MRDNGGFDLPEHIARIDRAIAENAKFQADAGGGEVFAPLVAVGTFLATVGGFAVGVVSLLQGH